MLQLPLLVAIRIRGPFQREREPQGQDGIDAVNEVSIATRNERSAQGKRTSYMHFGHEAETVNSEPFSFELIANSHERNLLGCALWWWCLTIAKRYEETSERQYLHEAVGQLDIYLCSDHSEETYRGVGSDRTNQRRGPDAIRVPNDDEECGRNCVFPVISDPRSFYADSWNERSYVPNAVPIDIGTNLNLSSAKVAHKLEASIGIRGRSMTTGNLEKADASQVPNLANIRLQKYARSTLFLKVIAYILRQNRVSRLNDTDNHGVPQRDEDFRGNYEKHVWVTKICNNTAGLRDSVSPNPSPLI